MANPVAVAIPSRNATASNVFLFVAATASAQNIPWPSGGILIGYNSGLSSRTVTIANNPASSRLPGVGLNAESIAAGAYRVYDRYPPQHGGVLVVTASHADVTFAILKP